MNNKDPKIVRSYHKVMVEIEVPHDLMDCEWDGVEYESIDEAKKAMQEAEKNPRVYNAWLESVSVDENGDLWDYIEGGLSRVKEVMYYRGWEVYCYRNEKEEYFILPVDNEELKFETWEAVVGYIDGQMEE